MVARRVVRRAGTPPSRCLDGCLAHIAGPHRLPRVLPASQDTEHPLADVQERPLPEATRDPLAPGAPENSNLAEPPTRRVSSGGCPRGSGRE